MYLRTGVFVRSFEMVCRCEFQSGRNKGKKKKNRKNRKNRPQ